MTVSMFISTFALKSVVMCKISPWILHEYDTPRTNFILSIYGIGALVYCFTPVIWEYLFPLLIEGSPLYIITSVFRNQYSDSSWYLYTVGIVSEIIGVIWIWFSFVSLRIMNKRGLPLTLPPMYASISMLVLIIFYILYYPAVLNDITTHFDEIYLVIMVSLNIETHARLLTVFWL